ncbi:Uncharacterised protein [Raoultella ornithinolytica]|nr:Uncharacterised protein [Raoultella ornithinolytica]VTN05317.1 Uncharacterised protein [Raoultella ornithinolytica]
MGLFQRRRKRSHQRGGRFTGTAHQQQRGGHGRGGQGDFSENRDATRAENHIRHRYRPLREDAFSYDSDSSQSVCVFSPRLTCCYVGWAGAAANDAATASGRYRRLLPSDEVSRHDGNHKSGLCVHSAESLLTRRFSRVLLYCSQYRNKIIHSHDHFRTFAPGQCATSEKSNYV